MPNPVPSLDGIVEDIQNVDRGVTFKVNDLTDDMITHYVKAREAATTGPNGTVAYAVPVNKREEMLRGMAQSAIEHKYSRVGSMDVAKLRAILGGASQELKDDLMEGAFDVDMNEVIKTTKMKHIINSNILREMTKEFTDKPHKKLLTKYMDTLEDDPAHKAAAKAYLQAKDPDNYVNTDEIRGLRGGLMGYARR